MKSVLFINIDIPVGLESISNYEDLRPGLDMIHEEDFVHDNFIHEKLSILLQDKEYDLIILPYSLDLGNYLNFTGINVGLHLRLTPELRHHKKPILFLGPESIKDILKLATNGHLFMTSGVFYSNKKDQQSVKRQIDWILENKPAINEVEYQGFIRKTIISPPEFFDNRHAITNEWGLLLLDRISGHFAIQNEAVLKKIQSNLYIKWLLVNEGVKASTFSNNEKPFVLSKVENKKILLIDDEWEKGWLKLFRSFFQHGEPNGAFVDFLNIEKGNSLQEIKDKFLLKKRENNWDIILLDIRLTDGDHNESTNYWDYAGFELLEDIKDEDAGNPGQQVILISASNKQWIYDYGRRLGADEVIIKPGFFFSGLNYNLEESIKEPTVRCIDRLILKEVFSTQKILIDELSSLDIPDENFEDLSIGLISLMKSGFHSFHNINSQDEEDLAVLFLIYFKLFEILGNYLIKYDFQDRLWIIEYFNMDLEEYWVSNGYLNHERNSKFTYNKPPGIAQKVGGILKQILNYDDSSVIEFYNYKEMRRKWVHPKVDKGELKTRFSKENCIEIFRLSTKVLNDFLVKYQN